MNETLYIGDYCLLRNGEMILNGESVFSDSGGSFTDFAKAAYHHFALSYPKFFKMDKLSKLAFLAASQLVNEGSNTALVFANRSASLDTDRVYQESILDKAAYYPSPSVFVYTLPNICLGEISIKYKLYAENSFFVFERFPAAFFSSYVQALLHAGKADEVLCGWVELLGEEYEALVYRVGKTGGPEHTEENLNRMI